MRLKSEDGGISNRPNQRYQRVFLQTCLVMLFICVVCYTYVMFDGNRLPSSFSEWNVRDALQKTFNRISRLPQKIIRERKRILLWTPFFSTIDWLPSTKELNCRVQECDVISNRSLLENSSALILHWRNINPNDFPPFLLSNENRNSPLVAIFNKESPSNTPMDVVQKIRNKIHLTITYRRDSDFFAPYGRIEKREDKFTKPIEFNASKRNVCWLVSNCHTSSNREMYVNQLKNYIDVDIYGGCGSKKCPHGHAFDCYKMLAEQCKFYLSFENSLCKDYVTEKLFYALMFDMVPIVMGGNDYSMYLPSHSFIDVVDYATPKALAKYLLEIAKDETQYLSYFKWKETYKATYVPYLWLCDLCELIHSDAVSKLKPHKDVISWWFEEANCGSL